MTIFNWLITHIAPIFLISAPITSYADQIISMHRKRTSVGFSLDIPLIMLVASILKVFYWVGARYDLSLLVQAVVMIFMQCLLLHAALAHRPPSSVTHQPFVADLSPPLEIPRPYNFWRWQTSRPFWTFLGYFTCSLAFGQVLFGHSPTYSSLLGTIALTVEAVLPVPQILANHQRRCCKGFRLSVLANWLIGDAFKMIFFFAKGASEVPWAFKLCGIFQAACDIFLGLQYLMFGDGEPVLEDAKQRFNWWDQISTDLELKEKADGE